MAESHVRIDEGIRRGPRRPRPYAPMRRDPETDRVEGIPANLDINVVLERYLAESTTVLAREFGVRRKTLVGWIREKDPKRWKAAQVVKALTRKEDAEEVFELGPEDALSLASARELLRSAQFDLERLDSPTWGQKQEVTIDHRITVEHSITDSADLLLASYKRGVQDTLHNARSTAIEHDAHNALRDDNARKLDNESMLSLPAEQQTEAGTILPDQAPPPGEKGSSKP